MQTSKPPQDAKPLNQDVKLHVTYGMTSALNLSPPTVLDLQRTTELAECLKPYNVSETDEELSNR